MQPHRLQRLVALLLSCATLASAFLLPNASPRQAARSSSRSGPLRMGREWITDGFPQIPDEQLKFVHEYLDTKGKNVVRGPARVPGPDGRIIEVLADQEVEIIGGIVYRTFLNGFPMVNEARLKQEGEVVLEIRWGENWETEGFTLEVMGVTGPECVEYTNRFCEATGCKQKGPMVIKPAYYEVPIEVTQTSNLEKLRNVQAGSASIEF